MNENEFEEIVSRHRAWLVGCARRIVGSTEDAEEVVQDAFVRAHRSLTAMPPQQRQQLRMKPWLYVITGNLARNRLRKRRLRVVSLDAMKCADAVLPSAQSGVPESIIDERSTRDFIGNALRCVPKKSRTVAWMRLVEGFSHYEIAQECGRPVGTVKSRVHRAVILMRKALHAPEYLR